MVPEIEFSISKEKKRIKRLFRDIVVAFELESDTKWGRIPQEILDFLRSAGGHSLVVKGEAGTGKTTFALQIVEELADEQAEYYLSSRVSDEALYRQFPWLKDRARRNNILRAGKSFLRETKPPQTKTGEQMQAEARLKAARELLRALARSESVSGIVRSELLKLEGQIEAGDLGGDESAYGSGEITDGSIVLDLGVMLPELELAYDLAETNLPKKTLVVIDSMDSLSEKYGIPASRIVNTLQKDLVENSGTNIVYLLETSERTSMDFLGDGVVVLLSEERNGRRIRMLVIEKLRGSQIERWRYTFTLADGRTRVFKPTWIKMPETMKRHVPVDDPGKGMVSTGIGNLDRVVGGLPIGALTLMEIGIDVPQEVVRCLELSLISDFLLKRRGVVWYPLNSLDYPVLDRQISMLVSREGAAKGMRVLDASGSGDSPYTFVATIEGSRASHDLRWDPLKYMLSGSSRPYLSLLGYDALEARYGRDVLADSFGHIDSARRDGQVVVAEATQASGVVIQLANHAQMHLKLESIEGAVVLCGQKPFTPYYHLEFEFEEGRPSARLIPML
jgi:KaiC/GvpD/RAD55 family RecA-like ATPase